MSVWGEMTIPHSLQPRMYVHTPRVIEAVRTYRATLMTDYLFRIVIVGGGGGSIL